MLARLLVYAGQRDTSLVGWFWGISEYQAVVVPLARAETRSDPQLTVTIMPTFVNHPTICQSTAPKTSPMMMPRKSGRKRT